MKDPNEVGSDDGHVKAVAPTPSTGVLVVRVWFDEGRFRARVTQTIGLNSPVERVWVTRRPGEVLSAVRRFLVDLTGSAQDP